VGEQKLLHYTEVLISAGRLDDAQRVLGMLKPETASRGGVDVLQTRADLLAAQRKWPEERRVIDDLLKIAPLNGRALISLGRAYVAEDDVARATLAFEAAYGITGSTYVASLELANIEIKNRHYTKSVEYLQRALSIEKTDAVQDFLVRVKTLAAKDS
jgi:tetratricopeptide (TPR) repeat protein